MNSINAWFGFALCMASMAAAAAQGPFDAARLSASPQQGVAAASQGARPLLRNVLCGIRQDAQEAWVCIDGRWMGGAEFGRRYRLKIVAIESIGVVLAGGRRVSLGESVAKAAYHESLSKGNGGEK